MNIILGDNPHHDLDELRTRVRPLLPPHTFATFSTAATRFFEEAKPASAEFLVRVQDAQEEVSPHIPALRGDFQLCLYGTTGSNKTFLPKPQLLRLTPEQWGWIRIKESADPRLLDHFFVHEMFHVCFETVYESWRKAVVELQVFPLWLLKQAAVMNYPFAEMVCDMAAEIVTERLGKSSPTSMVSYLKAKNPLSYEDFLGIFNRLNCEFAAVSRARKLGSSLPTE